MKKNVEKLPERLVPGDMFQVHSAFYVAGNIPYRDWILTFIRCGPIELNFTCRVDCIEGSFTTYKSSKFVVVKEAQK